MATGRIRMTATLPATGTVAPFVLPPLLREVKSSPPADLPQLRRVMQFWHDQVLTHPDATAHTHLLHRGVGPVLVLHVSRILLRLLQPRWHSPETIARHLGQTWALSQHLSSLALPNDAARRTVGKWQSAVLLATTPAIKAMNPVDRAHFAQQRLQCFQAARTQGLRLENLDWDAMLDVLLKAELFDDALALLESRTTPHSTANSIQWRQASFDTHAWSWTLQIAMLSGAADEMEVRARRVQAVLTQMARQHEAISIAHVNAFLSTLVRCRVA
jgi:hypothetical protein